MSVWYCKKHGLHGPMACCPDAERVTQPPFPHDPVGYTYTSTYTSKPDMKKTYHAILYDTDQQEQGQ